MVRKRRKLREEDEARAVVRAVMRVGGTNHGGVLGSQTLHRLVSDYNFKLY